jgi:hypothetical protein
MEMPIVELPRAADGPDEAAPDSAGQVTVKVTEVVGATFLGLLAMTLLVAYLRAEARCRGLLAAAAVH